MRGLRALAGSRIELLNAGNNYRLMEEVESTSAPFRVHPGAVYLHQGESFLVRALDLEAGHAILDPVRADYYTQPREISEVRILQPLAQKRVGQAAASLGLVRVTQQVVGYRRVQQFREEVLSVEDLDLPAQTFDNVALWWEVPSALAARVVRGRRGPAALALAGGLHAVEHAAIGLRPLFAMCDRWDIGELSTAHHADTGAAQVFVHDAFPGEVGIADKGFELLADLWQATYEAVRDCPCEEGCPSCIPVPMNNGQTTSDHLACWDSLQESIYNRQMHAYGHRKSPGEPGGGDTSKHLPPGGVVLAGRLVL